MTIKWACPNTIAALGIGNDFQLFCNNIGLHQFVFEDTYTYCRLALKFLSTLMHTVGHFAGQEDRIRFHLMDNNYDSSLNEWCAIFGFVDNDSHLRYSNYMFDPSLVHYYYQMSFWKPNPKGNIIESPAIHYFYYVIANTLQARGEFTKLNEEDMIILAKAAIPASNMTPNLGAMPLLHLYRQAH